MENNALKPESNLIERLAAVEAELARVSNQQPRSACRWLAVALCVLALCATTASALDAMQCTDGSGLVCLQSGQPARASDVNANFSTLLSRLATKADAGALAQKVDIAGIQTLGPWDAYQFDANGQKAVNMIGTNRGICFLSTFSISEIDAPSEWGTCAVEPVNGVWQLRSELSGTSNANLSCRARCFTW